MTKTAEIIVVTEQPESAEAPKPNPFPFFPNFNFNFNLQQLPFPFFQPKHSIKDKEEEEEEKATISDSKQVLTSKRNLVSFPNTQVVVPPPLQAEPDAADISNAKTSNPFIIWQVYAIAGFMVSRWIWARWNESKGRGGRPPNDDRAQGRHSDDGRGDYE